MNLEEFCDRFQVLQNQGSDTPELGEANRRLLRDFLQDPSWLGEFLQKFIAGPSFLSDQPVSVFDNEIRLYRSPDKSFSLLVYIWDSRGLCPVHDHGAWGIIGGLVGSLREIKYQRMDDKQVEGYAELRQVSDSLIKPEGVRPILPLDKGIHQTGSPDDRLTITFHIYGRSLGRGYIHFFDAAEKKVTRASRRVPFRKVLALQALASLEEAVGKKFLTQDLFKCLPEDLVKEFRRISLITE
ncbi:MAG: cysteine dioxygenase family protein [Deltaproteobacteria bacterium]|nr:cysteine dioxygenase family protein [Deltaproteobacteria bacterium]